MDDLTKIIVFTMSNYPRPKDLSNARLTKLIYLADWHHSLCHRSQVSNITWFFDNYGPFVWDVKNTVISQPQIFDVFDTTNSFGNYKTEIRLRDSSLKPKLSDTHAASLTFVIEKTQSLSWSDFIRLVYSTYPISSSSRYSFLDLVSMSAEYLERSRS